MVNNNMEKQYPEYRAQWVEILPDIGLECPVCHEGIIENNSFTGKDGTKWQSVKCITCRNKWIITQKRPTLAVKTETTEKQIRDLEIIDKLGKLKEALVIIDEKLNKLIKGLE